MAKVNVDTTVHVELTAEEAAGLSRLLYAGVGHDTMGILHLQDLAQRLRDRGFMAQDRPFLTSAQLA